MKLVDKVILRAVYFRRLSTEEDAPTWKRSYIIITEKSLIVLEDSAEFGNTFQIAIELKSLQLHTFNLERSEVQEEIHEGRNQPSRLTQMYLAEANDGDILSQLPGSHRYVSVILNSITGRHIHVAADSKDQMQRLCRALECSRLVHNMLLDRGLLSSKPHSALESIYDWIDAYVHKHRKELFLSEDLLDTDSFFVDCFFSKLADIDCVTVVSVTFREDDVLRLDQVLKKFNRSQIKKICFHK